MELTWASVIARRMQRQGLTTGHGDIVTAVSAMGGAHAQVQSAAELSIGVRVGSATLDQVRDAELPGGALVKTYGPRGTVHLLPRSELPLWCAALDAVPLATSLPPGVRLEPEEREAVIEAIGATLDESRPLDTDELGEAVVRHVGTWADARVVPAFGDQWARWRLGIQSAANRGVLAFGEKRGNRVTYLNPHVRSDLDQPRALTWLLRRYLSTYGPATPEHYARWLGVKRSWAAAECAAADVEPVTVDDESRFVNPGDTESGESLEGVVTLLPHFDPYVIGSFPRDRLFPAAAATRALGRGQAGVHPVLLLDGIVAGIWTGRRSGSRFELTVEPFAQLGHRQRQALEARAARIAEFVGADIQLGIGRVTAGAHK